MITFVIVFGIIAVMVTLMLNGSVASRDWHRQNAGKETVTENEHFYWRLFYYNPEDKSSKRTGVGITINYAHPLSIIAGILIIGALIAPLYTRIVSGSYHFSS